MLSEINSYRLNTTQNRSKGAQLSEVSLDILERERETDRQTDRQTVTEGYYFALCAPINLETVWCFERCVLHCFYGQQYLQHIMRTRSKPYL